MDSIYLTSLNTLLKLTSGSLKKTIRCIDGLISTNHPDRNIKNIFEIDWNIANETSKNESIAKLGTFIADIFKAKKKESNVPSVCLECTLLERPIFVDVVSKNEIIPVTKLKKLAKAILTYRKKVLFNHHRYYYLLFHFILLCRINKRRLSNCYYYYKSIMKV